ncbi:MAG: helix-turn-helix domain-containing protein [Nanoarchaeota archaeon]|nr:helix-turn-helix domain-containing protein [Nanoarchaeota archaeon]
MDDCNDYNFSKTPIEKVRDDIKLLQEELFIMKSELETIRKELSLIINTNFMNKSSIGNEGVPADQQTNTSTFNTPPFPVENVYSKNPDTPPYNPTDNPTHPQHMAPKIRQITPEMVEEILAREYMGESRKNPEIFKNGVAEVRNEVRNQQPDPKIDTLSDLTSIMNGLKADLKAKFRSLTGQEFYIFSVLYTVEKSQETVTYSDLAKRTGLTSSSIRDYIQRIIRKGIPINKEKMNNKVTLLNIPIELRSLATLDNLMRLRNNIPDESLDRFSSRK